MKTILHVVPTLGGGGAERQLVLLASEQARRGNHVHIALRRRGSYARQLAHSVELHDLGDHRRGHPLLFTRLCALVGRLRPDLVQTWLLQMDLVGGVVALAMRVPWVLTERNSREAYDEFPIASRLRQRLGQHASAIVTNSRVGADYWRGARCPVSIVGNALDLAAMEAVVATPTDEPLLLAVGRLVPQKAHDVLIDAVARVPRHIRFRVLILGDGEGRDGLSAKILEFDQAARIMILPYQDNWWGLLKSAHALVNLSRFEGQPNVVLEAMAAGCPLVVSDIPPHRALLDEHTARFVARDDAAGLAQAIVSVLRDPDAAHTRAKLAKQQVADKSIEIAVERYERVYAVLSR